LKHRGRDKSPAALQLSSQLCDPSSLQFSRPPANQDHGDNRRCAPGGQAASQDVPTTATQLGTLWRKRKWKWFRRQGKDCGTDCIYEALGGEVVRSFVLKCGFECNADRGTRFCACYSRPKTIDDVAAQEHTVNVLRKTLQSSNVRFMAELGSLRVCKHS
jgi:hypothetical protein